MEELIAFHIYRTERFFVSGRALVAHFLRQKNIEAYQLLVMDESTAESWMRCYSAETAKDFSEKKGVELEKYIFDILNGLCEK